MPNPQGKNSAVHFNGLVQNPLVYGDKARQGDLQRTAPLAGGGAASALNAPRRAGSQAKSGPTPEAAPVPSQPPGAAPQPTYQAQLAQTWAEIAAVPGASPLVQQLAQGAQIG
jgi:hypothetical protein